jgi:hypothetical protein
MSIVANMNKTILSQWSMKSQFLSLLHGHDDLLANVPQQLKNILLKVKSDVKGDQFNLVEDCY